ncbi:hypothetical protein ACEUAI_21070 [Aeromonas veronii]|nr:hypothetical protein [Aeromonas veronii]
MEAEIETRILASTNNIQIIKGLLSGSVWNCLFKHPEGYGWVRLCRHVRSYNPVDRASYMKMRMILDEGHCCYFQVARWIKREIKAIRRNGGQVGMSLKDKIFYACSSAAIITLLSVIVTTLDVSKLK